MLSLGRGQHTRVLAATSRSGPIRSVSSPGRSWWTLQRPHLRATIWAACAACMGTAQVRVDLDLLQNAGRTHNKTARRLEELVNAASKCCRKSNCQTVWGATPRPCMQDASQAPETYMQSQHSQPHIQMTDRATGRTVHRVLSTSSLNHATRAVRYQAITARLRPGPASNNHLPISALQFGDEVVGCRGPKSADGRH